MQLTDLIKPDEVRMVLGLSAKELTNAQLQLGMFTRRVRKELRDLGSAVLAHVEGMSQLDDGELSDALQELATLAVASEASTGLANLAPKTLSDGKAMRQRDTGTVDEVKAEVEERLKTAKDALRKALAGAGLAVATRTVVGGILGVSTPAVDRVTG